MITSFLLSTLVVFSVLEFYCRLQDSKRIKFKTSQFQKQSDHSTYLFKKAEHMEIHPAYSKYRFGDKTFFDELQACQNKIHIGSVESRNVSGVHINIVGGERVTQSSNERGESEEDWIILGGSTVLCLEVSDSMTSSSNLQAIIDSSSNRLVQVHNFGQAGLKAAKVDQLFPLFLSRYPKVTRVIVYFGVNDVGWIAGSRPPNRLAYVGDSVLDFLSVMSKFIEFLTLTNRSRRVSKASRKYAHKTLKKFKDFKEYFEKIKIQTYFILQPNVFNKVTPSREELDLIYSAEPLRIAGLCAAYETYIRHGRGLILSAVDTFSYIDECIFLDWCHVGIQGNHLLAKRFWEIINGDMNSGDMNCDAMNKMKFHRHSALKLRNIHKNKNEIAYNYPLF